MERLPLEILVFEIGGRRYGLPLAGVREIVRAVSPLPLPGAPPGVEGVINVRGRVVPVLDPRRQLRLPAKPVEPTDYLLLTQAGERVVALRVDRAQDLARVDAADVEEFQGTLPGGEHSARVAKVAGNLVLILDLHALLSPAGAAVHDPSWPDARPPDGEGKPS